jgi:hypothetical protein
MRMGALVGEAVVRVTDTLLEPDLAVCEAIIAADAVVDCSRRPSRSAVRRVLALRGDGP